MNVLLLGPERPELMVFFKTCGDHVISTEDKLHSTSPLIQEVDFLVSYGYRHILKPAILDQFPKYAINLHISLLPWNRGADPNLWSFLEDTPKGVTIHTLDRGIDTGDILVQQEVMLSANETLKTSYEKLSLAAQGLLQRSWLDIRAHQIPPQPQAAGGSYHCLRDRQQYEHLLTHGWDTPVHNLIGKAKNREK
ncbi:MAG: formyl transferase [Spirulina sp. SIO3F2]|nr:formyl transferase [Spirulina sp. SIO3F2]